MTDHAVVAVLLAAAVLTSPGPARGRLAGPSPSRGGRRRALTVAVALAVSSAGVSAPPAVLLVGLIAAAVVTLWRRRRRVEHHRRVEGKAMASALEVLIGELRVGAHPVRAFTAAAAETPGCVGVSLQRVAVRARLGADVGAGLLAAAGDSAIPAYWMRLAVLWELAAQRGLPISVLMRAAHQDIVERQRFTGRIRAALAGARATAAILAALPVLGIVLGELIGAHPLRFLLGGGLGAVLLVLGTGLIAAGLGWADRITDRLLT